MNSTTTKWRMGLIMFVMLLTACVFWLVMPQLTLAQKPQPRKLFPISQKGKCGFIDVTGKIRIAPVFDNVENFSEGLAGIVLNEKFGFIDKNGKVVIAPNYLPNNWGNPEGFSEGLVSVRMENGKLGYLDKTGAFAIAPQFYQAEGFSEGLAVIQFTQDGKYGYINKLGEVVISPQFNLAGRFQEGLAAVRIDCNLWGYINRTGKLVIEPQFRSVKRFSGGLAEIAIGERWGYINQSGKIVWMSDPPASEPKHQ